MGRWKLSAPAASCQLEKSGQPSPLSHQLVPGASGLDLTPPSLPEPELTAEADSYRLVIVTVAVAAFVGSATEVAETVTTAGLGTDDGAR